jgi:hypothetical protein
MTTRQPEWFSLSHHDRYRRLQTVREQWCRRPVRPDADVRGRVVFLDGAWIDDVPSFYLSLGEAMNGPEGYFGGGLYALSDCLCGGFGALPPLTIMLSHFDEVRNALDGRASGRFHAEHFRRLTADGETTASLVDAGYFGAGSTEEIARWTAVYEAALRDAPFEHELYGSYFAAIQDVLSESGARLVSATEYDAPQERTFDEW